MRLLFVLVLGLLAIAANGTNSCLDSTNGNYKCSPGAGATIDLSGCGISSADGDDLLACMDSRGRSSISVLVVTDYPSFYLPADLFAGMTSLQTLHLNYNDLTIVDGMFDDLSSLKHLSLTGNGLRSLPEDIFDNIGSLETLMLDDNDLKFLPEGVFDELGALKALNLSKNDLTLRQGVFEQLKVLEELYLGDNDNLLCVPALWSPYITVLQRPAAQVGNLACACPDSTFYGGYCGAGCEPTTNGYVCPSKSYCLDLEDPNNKCTAGLFSASLSGCGIADDEHDALVACLGNIGRPNLASIDLANNRLTSLPVDVFAGLRSVTTLDLSGNQFKTLPADVFRGVSGVSYLSLNDNRLAYLPLGLFYQKNEVVNLALQSNELTILPAGLFDHLEKLTYLDLQDNDGLLCLPSLAGSIYFNPPTGLKLPEGFDSITASCGCPRGGEAGACPGDCQPGVDGYLCSEAVTPAPTVSLTPDPTTAPFTPAPSTPGACAVEGTACNSIAGCGLCINGDDENLHPQHDACLAIFSTGITNGDDACQLYQTTACCLGQVPGYGCLEIAEFVAYVECYAGAINGEPCLDFLSSCPARTSDPSPAPSTSPGAGVDQPGGSPSPTPAPVEILTPGTNTPAPSTSRGAVDQPFAATPPTLAPTTTPTPAPSTPTGDDATPVDVPTPAPTPAPTAVPTPEGPLCSNGVRGIQVGDVCCHPGCSQCGGERCSSSGAARGLGSNECCVNTIRTSGNNCGQGEAPCIIEQACSLEELACQEEADCIECLTVEAGEEREEWAECMQAFAFDSDDTCASQAASACCLDQVSTNDCFGNNAFVEYYNCYSERESGQECPDLSESTCTSATLTGGVGADGSGAGRRSGVTSGNKRVGTFAAGAIVLLAAIFYW